MKLSTCIIAAAIFALPITTVSAGAITENWSATVSSTTHTAVATVGSELSWTVTYNPESTIMNQYHDGVDGIANTADDTISILWDNTNPVYSTFTYFSDATFDFGNIFTSMEQIVIDSGLGFRDAYSLNQSLMYANSERTYHEFIADHRDIILYDFANPQSTDTGGFNVYYFGPQHTPEAVHVGLTNINRNASVPEPGAVFLFTLGLIAISRNLRGSLIT